MTQTLTTSFLKRNSTDIVGTFYGVDIPKSTRKLPITVDTTRMINISSPEKQKKLNGVNREYRIDGTFMVSTKSPKYSIGLFELDQNLLYQKLSRHVTYIVLFL